MLAWSRWSESIVRRSGTEDCCGVWRLLELNRETWKLQHTATFDVWHSTIHWRRTSCVLPRLSSQEHALVNLNVSIPGTEDCCSVWRLSHLNRETWKWQHAVAFVVSYSAIHWCRSRCIVPHLSLQEHCKDTWYTDDCCGVWHSVIAIFTD